MPLTKQQKAARVTTLRGELAEAKTVLLASFERLTVAQDYQLRRWIRAAGGRYRVLKNTLAARAAVGTAAEPLLRRLQGVRSIAYTSGDAAALAQALRKFAKDNPELRLHDGLVEGQAVTAAEVSALADLPSREELLARLLGLIQAPSQRLVTVLAATGRNTAVVLDQAVKQKKFAAGTGSEP